MRLLRKSRSTRHFRIVEVWGYNDPPRVEEPNVVDFNIDTATLIPIYADPADEEGTLAPLEIILEENDRSHRYLFLDVKDILLVQGAITGFEVVANYMA